MTNNTIIARPYLVVSCTNKAGACLTLLEVLEENTNSRDYYMGYTRMQSLASCSVQ